MLHVWRMLGDGMHALSVLMFLVIVGVKGNGSGVSLKSQVLYLLVFMARYLDLFTTFYSWYNTLMKVFFMGCTVTMISILVNVEPARSTYSMAQDNCNHWNLVIGSAVFAMVTHLVGSGVVDIKGGSGQEFEVHFEHYSWLSYLWTFSVCLEPLAMVPQLYIFFKNRLLNRDIRLAIFFMGVYRIFYLLFWIFRAKAVSNTPDQRHHLLLYFSGGLQVLVYFDFYVYHWSVMMLWCLSSYGKVVGDSSSMVTDSGIENWALTATGREFDDYNHDSEAPEEPGWKPGDKPASKNLELKKMGKLGVI